MKKQLLLSSLILCYFSLTMVAQQMEYPVVKNGGGIYPVPDAEPIVDVSIPYKVVSEISAGVEKVDSLNPTLDKLARLVNLHRHAGVKKENFDLVVLIHFTATPIILTDEAYKKKFGVLNPNTKLINEMAENGVKFYVCGQSLYRRKYVNEPRNKNIKVVLSAMLGLTTFQSKDYVLIL